MNRGLKVFFFFTAFFFQSVSGCRWCFNDRIKVLVDESFGKAEVEKLISPLDGDYMPEKESKLFFDTCIYTFYPKANLMREVYFPTMCPYAIDAALREIVKLLNYETWFYFTNKKSGFRWGVYWERIVTICSVISTFIERAYVNVNDACVYEQASLFEVLDKQKHSDDQHISLAAFWREKGLTARYDFYAFYFDHLLKLFNEGIKFKDEKKASVYYFELEMVEGKLRASSYENMYEAALARAKRLRERLINIKNKKSQKDHPCGTRLSSLFKEARHA